MDYDKLAAIFQKVGFMPMAVGWLAWELHTFVAKVAESVAAQLVNQQQMVYLMQRLIDLHTK
jgi:hypothetical protein